MNLKEAVGRTYAGLFAHERTQGVNHALYHLALRGMGYNNGWQPERSGEDWFIRRVLAPSRPRTCLDVGANVGVYSALLLEHTEADVVAFEPLPGAFQKLVEIKESSARNRQRFTPVNSAVGATPGAAELHFGHPTSELASLSTEVSQIEYVGADNTQTMEVPVTTLDEFTSTEPWSRLRSDDSLDFVKIDVEGFEYEVLRGAQETIAVCRPRFVQIEWNLHQLTAGTSFLSVCKLLPGYTPHQLLPRGMRRVDPITPDANTFCYANFVFVAE